MRHRKKRTRFGRQPGHHAATLKGLTRSVILHQRIKTTHTKAKEARKVIEGLITTAKEGSLQARRKAFAILGDRTLVSSLFKDIVPLFKNRKSGYTRIIPYNFRKGDGASIVFLELTEKKPEEKPKPVKGAKKEERDEKAKAVKKEAKKEKAEHPSVAPQIEPKTKEEKTREEVKKEKAKREVRKIEKQKGFLKKVKGFFRRKTNM
ncbi:MAG: 50S ribosomal protein L17 [Candidatus Omnitrophica bacterium]|nr:50S ribosomal protein L17 [Candidatus Omnitrophota bacterium]